MPATFERNPFRDLFPSRAAIDRLEDPGAWPIRGRVDKPRWTAHVPKRRVDYLRIHRIELKIDRADVVVFEQNFLPRDAAVARAINTAVGIRRVNIAKRCDKQSVRVLRVDDDAADLFRS